MPPSGGHKKPWADKPKSLRRGHMLEEPIFAEIALSNGVGDIFGKKVGILQRDFGVSKRFASEIPVKATWIAKQSFYLYNASESQRTQIYWVSGNHKLRGVT